MNTLIKENSIVLFQGDSVTDSGRDYNNPDSIGFGYAGFASSLFLAFHSEMNVKFYNRGISSNRTSDLRTRWQQDCIDLKPDWVSILIGVNDTCHRYYDNHITTLREYEENYRDILTRTKNELKAKIIICEPFMLNIKEEQALWREDLDPKIQVTRKLAMEFEAIYIPLDGIFSAAASRTGNAFWVGDGVHPSSAGHALIAKTWLEAVKAI